MSVNPGPGVSAIEQEEFEQHRRPLTGFCYRMLGSSFEAEDAVQETMLRAWRNSDSFEGRSAVRSWLYRIATNVCLDMLRSGQRRARPMDLGPSAPASATLGPQLPENVWVTPVPDAHLAAYGPDPAEMAVSKDSIRLAFIAALQQLPPKQRAVLILRDVLRWQASEVAELLDTSVASVNSALQRANATLTSEHADFDLAAQRPSTIPAPQKALLSRYVDAFERYDITSLVSLLREDATLSMPPYELWLRGRHEVGAWFVGTGVVCRGSRLVPTAANGCAAFGQYHADPEGGHTPWALQVVEMNDDAVTAIHNFLDTSLFSVFGLPPRLDS